MTTTLKILTLILKGVGIVTAMDVTSLSPKYGILIFMGASIVKDVVTRIGDYLDDKIINNSFGK